MANRWREIWNKREKVCEVPEWGRDEFTVYTELKKLDGFDVSIDNEEAYYRCFYNSTIDMWEQIRDRMDVNSVYEVGCGSGANLYLLKNRGIQVGGIDYSQNLVDTAKKIIGEGIEYGEALNISSEDQWDIVLSDSVFAYFPDESYGESVLKKMFQKARKMVILSEVFNKSLEEECNRHRRAMVENYDEKYAGLDKVFYPKELFIDFAEKNNCSIWFSGVENPYYWNSPYLYNCFIKKND